MSSAHHAQLSWVENNTGKDIHAKQLRPFKIFSNTESSGSGTDGA